MNTRLKLAGVMLAGVLALGAGGVAVASMENGLGPLGRADANSDGKITRAEWVQEANARFDRLDANKDGKLVSDELPRHGPRGPHRGHHGPHDGGPGWEGAPPPPPPPGAPQPAAPASPAPQK